MMKHLPILFLFLLSLPLSKALASERMTVSLDDISNNDTIIYCSDLDTVSFSPPDFFEGTGIFGGFQWIYNNGSDTSYATIFDYVGKSNSTIGDIRFVGPGLPLITISFYVSPFDIQACDDLQGKFGDSLDLSVTSELYSPDTLTYEWTPSEGLSNAHIANPTFKVVDDITYYVAVTSPEGCVAYDSVSVSVDALDSPEICMVSINSYGQNMIVWEPQTNSAVDSILIYKETFVSGQYEKAGSVSSLGINYFDDTLSNPKVQSNRYRISVKDASGRESEQSDIHRTLHLSVNKGTANIWNLIWEPYEGFDIPTYYIYRGDKRGNLSLVGTSPSSNTQYSDLTAPVGAVYYQLAVVAPDDCSLVELRSVEASMSYSNIVAYEPISGINGVEDVKAFSLFPNPCDKVFTVSLKEPTNARLSVMTVSGALVMEVDIKSNEKTLDVSALPKGVYLVSLVTPSGISTQQLLVD